MWRRALSPSPQAAIELTDLATMRRQAAGRASINANRIARHRRPVSPKQQAAEQRRLAAKVENRT